MYNKIMELPFHSVIFDLDGVITKTAVLHFKAWKSVFDDYLKLRAQRDNETFKEFTQQDYLAYVDGKPRYDGVKSFLESRGIDIPYGRPEDPPSAETVCGIGNRKNAQFLDILRKEGVEVYTTTIEFIRQLKGFGVKIGVASSSKNCQEILQRAGIEELFDTRVDGKVSQELKLKGKPEPDIFVRSAYNLGATPANSIVVEDATSGVMAGRNGGFGLVVGIARKNNHSALFENGADIVVSDVGELSIDWVKKWFFKKPRYLPQEWEKCKKEIIFGDEKVNQEAVPFINPCYFKSPQELILQKGKVILFLDYDGTLTPIVERPDLAVLSSEMKEILMKLSQKFIIAIVSGRSREDVEKLVGISGIFYAGNHGFDIKGPGISRVQEQAEKIVELIPKLKMELHTNLGDIPGLLLEEKKFSIAVHYRMVDEDKYLNRIVNVVEEVVKNYSGLRIMKGKKVLEILPDIDWNKGRAIRWLMDAMDLSWEKNSVIYIGDDVTDEDAFRTIRTRGTAILVSEINKVSCADFYLNSPQEVAQFFNVLLGQC